MADPSQVAAIWQRAVTRFPQLGIKWGTEVPTDPVQLEQALTDYRNFIDRPFLAAPETVPDPNYFTSEFLKEQVGTLGRFGKTMGRGFVEDFTHDNPVAQMIRRGTAAVKGDEFVDPRFEERFGKPDNADGTYSTRQIIEPVLSEGLSPFEVLEDVGSPFLGFLMSQPGFAEEGIKERVDIMKERAGEKPGQGWNPFPSISDIDMYSTAYREATDAGEIPWYKQVLSELPMEILAGKGIGYLANLKNIRKLPPGLAPTGNIPSPNIEDTPVAAMPESRVPYSPVQIEPDMQSAFRGTTAPEGVIGPPPAPISEGFTPMQRALSMEETPEGILRAIPQDEMSLMGEGQLRLGETVPWQQQPTAIEDFVQTPGAQLELPLRSPMQGERLPDITAEELLARQADEAKWEWQPGQPIGRQTTPSGKRRTWKIGDVTKAQQREVPQIFGPRIDVGVEVQNLLPSIDKVPPNVQPQIDRLIAYSQRGVDLTNPGYRRWTNQWLEEVAESIFGDRSQSSVSQVRDYVSSLPGQQELPFEDFGNMMMQLDTGGNVWLDWLDNFFIHNVDTDTYTPRPNRPLPVTQHRWKGVEEETDIANFIDETVGSYAGELDLHATSPWIRNFPLIAGKIFDTARQIWKDYATPDELESLVGITGYVKPKKEDPLKTLSRLYEGNVAAHDNMMAEVIRKGSDELVELGWFERKNNQLFVKPESIGTWDVPGPVRILFNALHSPGDPANWQELKRLGPDAVRQYWNLRALTNWEQSLRGEHKQIKLKDFDLNDIDQYFYRGVKPEGMDFKEFAQNINKLGRTKSISMHRINQSWLEMQQIGLRPLFWNPYEQAMYSSKLGYHGRLQTNFLEILLDESLNMAKFINRNDDRFNALKVEGWEEVTNAGPALKTSKFYSVPKHLANASGIDANKHFQEQQGVWLFPKNVANGLNDLFGRTSSWEQAMRDTRFTWLNHNFKIDDIIFIPKRIDLYASLFQHVDMTSRAVTSGFATPMTHLFKSLQELGHDGNIQDPDAWMKVFHHWDALYKGMPLYIARMWKAVISKDYRLELADLKNSHDDWYKGDPVLEGKTPESTYNWANAFRYGLASHDQTVFGTIDDQIEMYNDVITELGWKKTVPVHMGRFVKKLETEFQDGLFQGMYPAGIMHDFRYNTLPLVRRLNPNLSPEASMGMAAKMTNKAWSSIPKSQSTIKGWFRGFLRRFLFSLGEREAFTRQFTGMFRGSEKTYWSVRNASTMLWMALLGNLVHFATTGEHLPVKRYIPFIYSKWSRLKYQYNPQLFSPDIPISTRAGNNATMDLMNQFDTVFRVLDAGYGIPILGGMMQGLGTTPRAILNQVTSTNFRGEDIGMWGFGQRAIQLMYDVLGPIGLEQIGNALIVKSIGDKNVPAIGPSSFPIIAEGATVADLIPTGEKKLSLTGIGIQGITGINLKTEPGDVLKNMMVTNTLGPKIEGKHPIFPDIIYTTWDEVEKDKQYGFEMKRVILNDPRNALLVQEMETRRAEGRYSWYEEGAKAIADIRDSNQLKYREEINLIDEHAMKTTVFDPDHKIQWDPHNFRSALSAINSRHSSRVEGIEAVYKFDPITKMVLDEMGELPERSEDPLGWAIGRFYELKDEHTNELGETDFDALDAAWEIETNGWDDDIRKETGGLKERFDIYMMGIPGTHSHHHPFVQEYLDEMNELDAAGYWQDGPKKIRDVDGNLVYDTTDVFFQKLSLMDRVHGDELNRLGETSFSIWNQYLAANSTTRRIMESHSNYAATNIIKLMKKTRSDHRIDVLMENPMLDRYTIKWFGNTPTLWQHREYFKQLYGHYPSRIRTLSTAN